MADDLKLGKVGVDPLTLGPDAGRIATDRCVKALNGFPRDVVERVGMNLVLTSIRQRCNDRKKALDAFDQLVARSRAVLAEHFDNGGKRRSIFPFHQTVQMPLLTGKDLKRY